MSGNIKDAALKSYLATGAIPVPVNVAVVASVTKKVNPIKTVLTNLCSVGMLAKDLHYRALGKAFYAIHQLSDLAWDATRAIDELIEVYYLGECKSDPPMMADIYEEAAKLVRGSCVLPDQDGLISALEARCAATEKAIEDARVLPLRSGTNAVLDEISKKVLVSEGLIHRTGRGIPTVNDADCE